MTTSKPFSADPRIDYEDAQENLIEQAYAELTTTGEGVEALIDAMDDRAARIAAQADIDILDDSAVDEILDIVATDYGCLTTPRRRLFDIIDNLAQTVASGSVGDAEILVALIQSRAYI